MTHHPEAPIVSYQAELEGTTLWLVEAIDPDGQTELWLMDEAADDDTGTVGPVPEHERTGRLTPEWRRRLGLECGAVSSTTGKPCRNVVGGFGERCGHHRESTASQPTLWGHQEACGS